MGNNIAVIVFIIGSLQNQLRDRIDESANVTDLERAESTMRKSRQKEGGTKTEAVGHIRPCIEMCRAQLRAGRHFLFEHPADARSWDMPELDELAHDDRVFSSV